MRSSVFKNLFLQKLLTHVERSLSTISHSEDHGSATSYDVAASIDFLNRALHLVIYGNRILSAEFQSLDALRNEGIRLTPTATITWSHSKVMVSPVASGRRRPLASGSPSCITSKTTAFTAPFSSASYSFGLCKVMKLMPSSLACFTSSSRAGISAPNGDKPM